MSIGLDSPNWDFCIINWDKVHLIPTEGFIRKLYHSNINLGHTTKEGSTENHEETSKDKVRALIREHCQTSTYHQDNHNQAPVFLLQFEEKGEEEYEDDAGGLGDGVQGYIYVLETPLRQGNIKRGHHCHDSYSTKNMRPA